MNFFQRLNPLRRKPIQLEDDPYDYNIHQYKVRFSIVGPVGSGKSTLASALVLTAETMSAQIKNFYCRVLPKSSNIMVNKNNLRAGRFPPKTDPFQPVAPEAGLVIGHSGSSFRKDKVLQIPICDVGGEIYDILAIRRPTQQQYDRIKNINRAVVNHIRESQGFIIALPATDAIMFRDDYRMRDTDSYIYHVISRVMDYKRYYKKKIKAAAVWITKWDLAMDNAQDLNMDIYRDERSLERFLLNGFPGISSLLKSLRDEGKVRYFRSYFTPAKRADGTPDTWEDGSPKIKIEENPDNLILQKPEYPDQDFVDFIKWAASFAK